MPSDTISGDIMSRSELPDWERVLSRWYPQPNGESALQQLEIQLSTPLPYDLEETNLREYKNLAAPWTEWDDVEKQCQKVAKELFESRER